MKLCYTRQTQSLIQQGHFSPLRLWPACIWLLLLPSGNLNQVRLWVLPDTWNVQHVYFPKSFNRIAWPKLTGRGRLTRPCCLAHWYFKPGHLLWEHLTASLSSTRQMPAAVSTADTRFTPWNSALRDPADRQMCVGGLTAADWLCPPPLSEEIAPQEDCPEWCKSCFPNQLWPFDLCPLALPWLLLQYWGWRSNFLCFSLVCDALLKCLLSFFLSPPSPHLDTWTLTKDTDTLVELRVQPVGADSLLARGPRGPTEAIGIGALSLWPAGEIQTEARRRVPPRQARMQLQ